MGLIYLDDIKPGMKLEKDLVCPNGRFLLPSGSTLEDKHIKIARSWGITEAYIEGTDRETLNMEAEARIAPEIMQAAADVLAGKYSHVDLTIPAMHEIYRLNKLMIASDMEKHGTEKYLSESSMQEVGLPNNFVKGRVSSAAIVDKEAGLASFPDIYYKIKEVLDSPISSAAHMADLVEKDTSLSAKLLKMVNSAFYSFPSRIDSIRRAITIIGTRELGTLAVGISAIEAFKGIPVELTDMRRFWQHSISCGIFARLLGTHIDEVSTERLFVSGLLHDIGRLVIFRNLPEVSAYILYTSQKEKKPLAQVEFDVLGFDHAEVGSALMEKWKFPSHLVKNVRFHHTMQPVYLESSVVAAADCMAVAFGTSVSSSNIVPDVSNAIWESMGISTSVIVNVVSQSGKQIQDVENVFFG